MWQRALFFDTCLTNKNFIYKHIFLRKYNYCSLMHNYLFN